MECHFSPRRRSSLRRGSPIFYLDLALAGVILYDTDRYIEAKLRRIREIIKETGLKRERIPGGFFWDWKKYPGPDWEISWKGFESGT